MTKAKPKKKGRPSLYTEALAAKICRRLAGSSILPRWTHHGPTMAVQRPSRPQTVRSTPGRKMRLLWALSPPSARRRPTSPRESWFLPVTGNAERTESSLE